MEFFDKLGKKATEAYKVTADKTGKLAKEAKLRMKMNELKSQINEIYIEIGKEVYEKHIREKDYDIKKELEEHCTKIDVLTDDIETMLKECLQLKDRKQCPNCYAEIEKDVKFCPNCGEKQEDVKQDDNKEDIQEDEQETKQAEIIENECENQENEEEQTNLEKTVEIESNVKLEDDKTIEDLDVDDE